MDTEEDTVYLGWKEEESYGEQETFSQRLEGMVVVSHSAKQKG